MNSSICSIQYQPACREAVMHHSKRLADIAGILKDVTVSFITFSEVITEAT